MSRGRRRLLARFAGVVGVCTQFLVGLLSIVIFPAAFVACIAGVAGVRLVLRDLEAASLRLGVALLASGVGLLFGFASGVLPFAVTAIVSTASFGAALAIVRGLAREARTAFGIRHRDWERRNTKLQQRRDELVDRAVSPDGEASSVPPGAPMPPSPLPPPDAEANDEAAWWRDLE